MGDLPARVHARIGAPTPYDAGLRARDRMERLLEGFLDAWEFLSARTGLALPSAVGPSVVCDERPEPSIQT